MSFRGKALTVIVLTAVVATTSCTASSGSSDQPAALVVPTGRPTVVTPARLLQATKGATPVKYEQPAHGKFDYGPAGDMIYTPDPGFTGTDHLTMTTTDAVHLYTAATPPIANLGGVEIQGSAAGSAIAAVPGKPGELYGLTDRGPNVDGRAENEKVLPLPDFNPHITRFRLADGTATEVQTIGLSGPDGKPLNGLIDPAANTGEVLVGLDGARLPTSDHGIDPEGLVALPDGTFWVSDEYGPALVHFDAAGRELERLSPFNGSLPRELALRSPNQGMEGLTVTPDGKTLVGIMQSALKTPGLAGSAKAVPFSRIVTVDLGTKAIAEYLYPLTDPQQSNVAVSEITALSSTTFLVDERDGNPQPNGDKKIYVADIASATDVGPRAGVIGATYEAAGGGLLINNVPLETFVGVTDDASAADRLLRAGIAVANKSLKVDLSAMLSQLNRDGEFFGHDKIEGLATPDGGTTLVISNDNDFGLDGVEPGIPPLKLKPKTVPNGTPDGGEFLVVDTYRLPPQLTTVTLPITVE